MPKSERIISTNVLAFIFFTPFLILLPFVARKAYLHIYHDAPYNLYIILSLMIAADIPVFLYSLYNNRKRKDLNLPGVSSYNPRHDMIEIHIGKSAGKKKKADDIGPGRRFIGYTLQTIYRAYELKKNVLFYTYHLAPEQLAGMFGDAIEVTPVTGMFKYLNISGAFCSGLIPDKRGRSHLKLPLIIRIFRQNLRIPYYQCVINIKQLEEIHNLNTYDTFHKSVLELAKQQRRNRKNGSALEE